jgi:hypothetical protein
MCLLLARTPEHWEWPNLTVRQARRAKRDTGSAYDGLWPQVNQAAGYETVARTASNADEPGQRPAPRNTSLPSLTEEKSETCRAGSGWGSGSALLHRSHAVLLMHAAGRAK